MWDVCYSIDLLVYSYFLSCVPSLIPCIVLMLQLIVFLNFAILISVYQISAYYYTIKIIDALTMLAYYSMYVRKIPPALHFNLIDISDFLYNFILI
jgi:hypothetical protein